MAIHNGFLVDSTIVQCMYKEYISTCCCISLFFPHSPLCLFPLLPLLHLFILRLLPSYSLFFSNPPFLPSVFFVPARSRFLPVACSQRSWTLMISTLSRGSGTLMAHLPMPRTRSVVTREPSHSSWFDGCVSLLAPASGHVPPLVPTTS